MTKAAKSAAEPSFEKALAELESLVAKMEDGGLSLEQSLAAHKRRAASIASGRFRSRVMLRFPWLYWLK